MSRVTRSGEFLRDLVKSTLPVADTQCMMISKEQARAAAVQLATRRPDTTSHTSSPVSAELIAEAIEIARSTPMTDATRLAGARSSLAAHPHDTRDIAAMMIHRIVSDALR